MIPQNQFAAPIKSSGSLRTRSNITGGTTGGHEQRRGKSLGMRNFDCLPEGLSENSVWKQVRASGLMLGLWFIARGLDCFQGRQLILSPNSPDGDFGGVIESPMEYFAQVTKGMVAGGLSPRVQHPYRNLHSGPVCGGKVTKRAPSRRMSGIGHILGDFLASFKSCRGHHPKTPVISGVVNVPKVCLKRQCLTAFSQGQRLGAAI